MKTKSWILAITIALQFTSCNSQESNNLKQVEENNPHEHFKVTKKFDDDGNLIAFDSVYSSYYSNFNGDTLYMDSVMKDFDIYFNQFYGDNNAWGNFYLHDTTPVSAFFHDDFFENRFLEQNEEMLRMMQEMDSLKNSFFRQHSRNLIPMLPKGE